MGLEFLFRSTDGRFQTFAGYAKSFSPEIDSKDYFYSTRIGYDNRNISVCTNLAGLGENYKADIGYIRGQEYYDASRDTFINIGFNHWFSRFAYTLYPENNQKIISHEFQVRNIYDADTTFSVLSNDTEFSYTIKFVNTSQFQLSFKHNMVNLLFPFTFINDEPLPADLCL